MNNRFAVLATAVAALGLAIPATSSAQIWEWHQEANAPAGNIGTIRLAADSGGKVYASLSVAGNMTIFTTDDVLADPVVWEALVTDNAMANGFQGLVVDAADNFYVAGESGTAGTNTLRKFDSNGDLVTDFGTAGVVTPTARLTGMTQLSDGTLLATTFGGVFFTFDPVTGAETAAADSGAGNFIRDITALPDDTLFATRNGSLIKITGGSAADPLGYDTVDIVSAQPDVTSAVRPGVFHNASDNTIIFGNHGAQFTVIDVDTETELQVLTRATEAEDPFINTADAVTIDGGDGFEYLILCSNNAGPAVSIYRRALSTSVQDWSILE